MVLLKEDLKHIIECYLKSKDFDFLSFENSNLDEQAIGFMSDQGKKLIKFRTGDKIKKLYVFIKQLPSSKYHHGNIIQMGNFQRESLVFGEILANFQDFSIPIPKCYLSRADGTIVLEDISAKGYQNKNLYETLDLLHCEKVLDSLAKFHAVSFIIERKQKFKINEKYPIIETEVLVNGDVNHVGYKTTMAAIKAIKKVTEIYLPQYSTDVTNNVFNFLENIFDKFGKSDVFPNALSHSDLWANNLMFKYDKQGNLEDAYIIDFQLTTYKPPIFDILFFLHLCTTKDFRDNYYTHLSKLYFNALSKQLELSNIDINDIMSWSDFEKMHKEALPTVLGKTPLYLTFILLPPHIFKDEMETDEKFKHFFEENRTEQVLQAMKSSEFYRFRTLECLKELFDYSVNVKLP